MHHRLGVVHLDGNTGGGEQLPVAPPSSRSGRGPRRRLGGGPIARFGPGPAPSPAGIGQVDSPA